MHTRMHELRLNLLLAAPWDLLTTYCLGSVTTSSSSERPYDGDPNNKSGRNPVLNSQVP